MKRKSRRDTSKDQNSMKRNEWEGKGQRDPCEIQKHFDSAVETRRSCKHRGRLQEHCPLILRRQAGTDTLFDLTFHSVISLEYSPLDIYPEN